MDIGDNTKFTFTFEKPTNVKFLGSITHSFTAFLVGKPKVHLWWNPEPPNMSRFFASVQANCETTDPSTTGIYFETAVNLRVRIGKNGQAIHHISITGQAFKPE